MDVAEKHQPDDACVSNRVDRRVNPRGMHFVQAPPFPPSFPARASPSLRRRHAHRNDGEVKQGAQWREGRPPSFSRHPAFGAVGHCDGVRGYGPAWGGFLAMSICPGLLRRGRGREGGGGGNGRGK